MVKNRSWGTNWDFTLAGHLTLVVEGFEKFTYSSVFLRVSYFNHLHKLYRSTSILVKWYFRYLPDNFCTNLEKPVIVYSIHSFIGTISTSVAWQFYICMLFYFLISRSTLFISFLWQSSLSIYSMRFVLWCNVKVYVNHLIFQSTIISYP